MSTLAEIEKAIEKLPPNEFTKLVEWVDSRREQEAEDPEFKDALDVVFEHHAPLLDKLAQ